MCSAASRSSMFELPPPALSQKIAALPPTGEAPRIELARASTGRYTIRSHWQDGWIVYVDADASSTFSADEEILRVQQALDGQNTLTTTGIGAQVLYDYRGFVDAASVGSFLLCDDRTGPYGKTVSISNTGRVRTEGKSPC